MDPEILKLLNRPTITVNETSRVLGMSRNGTYEAVHRGDIRSVRMGKLILIPTAPLRKQFGMDEAVAA